MIQVTLASFVQHWINECPTYNLNFETYITNTFGKNVNFVIFDARLPNTVILFLYKVPQTKSGINPKEKKVYME